MKGNSNRRRSTQKSYRRSKRKMKVRNTKRRSRKRRTKRRSRGFFSKIGGSGNPTYPGEAGHQKRLDKLISETPSYALSNRLAIYDQWIDDTKSSLAITVDSIALSASTQGWEQARLKSPGTELLAEHRRGS